MLRGVLDLMSSASYGHLRSEVEHGGVHGCAGGSLRHVVEEQKKKGGVGHFSRKKKNAEVELMRRLAKHKHGIAPWSVP